MSQFQLKPDYSFAGGVPSVPFKLHESMISKLDPEYVKFFDSTLSNKPNIVYTHRVPLDELRSAGNIIPGQSPLAEMEKIYDIELPRKYTEAPQPIPTRVFIPFPSADKPEDGWPLLVWFHGGGWVLGGLSTENSYCTNVANICKCVVISVDYRLAPQDPFPACVDDAFESVMWAFESGPADLQINRRKICVGGSSAGGNLTAIVTHKFASSPLTKELPPICFQLMVVPVTDNSATPETQPSWGENEYTPQLPAEKMIWYRSLYLQKGGDEYTTPESSPLFYSNDSFSKVPPCFIAAAECDVLRSEAEAYAAKLKKNGVSTDIVIYAGMPHPVMVMDGVLKQGKDLIRDTTNALKRAFNTN